MTHIVTPYAFRIKLSSHDHNSLLLSVNSILDAICKKENLKDVVLDATVVNTPTKRSKLTVLRSPHIDKKSREQFEQVIWNKLIQVTFHPGKATDITKDTWKLLTNPMSLGLRRNVAFKYSIQYKNSFGRISFLKQ